MDTGTWEVGQVRGVYESSCAHIAGPRSHVTHTWSPRLESLVYLKLLEGMEQFKQRVKDDRRSYLSITSICLRQLPTYVLVLLFSHLSPHTLALCSVQCVLVTCLHHDDWTQCVSPWHLVRVYVFRVRFEYNTVSIEHTCFRKRGCQFAAHCHRLIHSTQMS